MISKGSAGDGAARSGTAKGGDGEALEDARGRIDTAGLPSFRPLTATARLPRPRPPAAETSSATAALPFSRARALSTGPGPAPWAADTRIASARRTPAGRPGTPRSSRYGLLLCIFLAGAVAGIGGRYVADAPGIDSVLAQAREQARAALALLPHMAPRRALAVSESLPARPALPSAAGDPAPPAAIVVQPGSDASAPTVEAPAPALTADAASPASSPEAPLEPAPRAVVAPAEPPPSLPAPVLASPGDHEPAAGDGGLRAAARRRGDEAARRDRGAAAL